MTNEEYISAKRAVRALKPSSKACIIAVLNDTEDDVDDVRIANAGAPGDVATLCMVLADVLEKMKGGQK